MPDDRQRTTFDDEVRDLDAEKAQAERERREAGGGEAEGFEQAEEAAQDRTEDPTRDREPGKPFPPEAESDQSGAAYGEADGQDPDEAAH
jgi:hypothetical protein